MVRGVLCLLSLSARLLAYPPFRRQPSRQPPGLERAPLGQYADRQRLPEGHGAGNAVPAGPGAAAAGAAPQAERVEDDRVPGNNTCDIYVSFEL